MDISRLSLKFDESKEFEIIDPLTNQASGGFITIASTNSKIGRATQLEYFRNFMQLTAELQKEEDEKAKLENREPIKIEVSEDEAKVKFSHILADLILDFRGLKDGKKEFKYSKQNAIKLLKSSNVIYEMVNRYSINQGLFIKE